MYIFYALGRFVHYKVVFFFGVPQIEILFVLLDAAATVATEAPRL